MPKRLQDFDSPRDISKAICELLLRWLDRNAKTRLLDIGEAWVAIQKYRAKATDTSSRPDRCDIGPEAATIFEQFYSTGCADQCITGFRPITPYPSVILPNARPDTPIDGNPTYQAESAEHTSDETVAKQFVSFTHRRATPQFVEKVSSKATWESVPH